MLATHPHSLVVKQNQRNFSHCSKCDPKMPLDSWHLGSLITHCVRLCHCNKGPEEISYREKLFPAVMPSELSAPR